MDPFPFTEEEWAGIDEIATGIVNASFAEDDVLHASRLEELWCVLAELRDKYGPHPVLLETQADFAEEPSERVALYEQAKQGALAEGLLTYTIRISFARVLVEYMGDGARAIDELLACKEEVAGHADDYERREWQELHDKCARLLKRTE
jgi:hypothetical protein